MAVKFGSVFVFFRAAFDRSRRHSQENENLDFRISPILIPTQIYTHQTGQKQNGMEISAVNGPPAKPTGEGETTCVT
jgi:hypothetical protein